MKPTSAIITNIDADHLDCYKDLNEIKDAFVQFANSVPFYGQVIICMDDAGNQDVLSRLRKPVVTYGFNRQADYHISTLNFKQGMPVFEVVAHGKSLGEFSLKVPGRHNILNATAAIALSLEENIPVNVVRTSLAEFTGVKPYRRVVVVFQPHLYSRTLDHYENFGAEFMNCDELLVLDVYGARERPIEGVSGAMVATAADRRGHRSARFVPTKEAVLEVILREHRAGDLVVLMGAGDVWKLGKILLEKLG